MAPSQIQVIDALSNEILYECSLQDSEKAYAFASEMEELGLDIKVISPTITQTLTDSLGMNHDEKEEYENSVVAEIHDHEGGCCTTEVDTSKLQ
jgi:hypothetical protein